MSLADNLTVVQEKIQTAITRSGAPRTVQILAITKTHPPAAIREAVNRGLNHIGENRVQEAAVKFSELPENLSYVKHMVGHLQSNKVNKAITIFDRIDAVDSLRLARKIGKRSRAKDMNIPVLLEVNTSGEVTKYGFEPENIEGLLACLEIQGTSIEGLMTLGPLTQDQNEIRRAFSRLRELKETLNDQRPTGANPLMELSMGMSGDFEVAIEEGSTMVRLGTVLFGPRKPYS